MKPIAAVWHVRGPGAGDYPVAIVDTYVLPQAGPVFGAIVVDSAHQLRSAPMGELEIVDDEVNATIARAQGRWSGR